MRIGAGLMLACLAAACASPQGPSAQATRPVPSPPVPDAPGSLPADLVVSSNEPFWQVRVEGALVTLTGLTARRTLSVDSNEAVSDGRQVLARDAQGVVEVRVAARQCRDSMSGALFPYTARLTIDRGAPIPRCARGLNDPRPAEPGN